MDPLDPGYVADNEEKYGHGRMRLLAVSDLAAPLPRAYQFLDGSAYLAHVERMFDLAGLGNGSQAAATIMALETRLAARHMKKEQTRDMVALYNKLPLTGLPELMPNFDEARFTGRNGKPFSKFKDFVREAERRSLVQIFASGSVNEVFFPDEDPYEMSQFAPEPQPQKKEGFFARIRRGLTRTSSQFAEGMGSAVRVPHQHPPRAP